RRLRDLTFHPELHIDFGAGGVNGEAVALANRKRQWLAATKTPANAAERHRGIASVNQALQPYVAEVRRSIEKRLVAASEQTRAQRVLNSREYASCLFPREVLERFLLDFPV